MGCLRHSPSSPSRGSGSLARVVLLVLSTSQLAVQPDFCFEGIASCDHASTDSGQTVVRLAERSSQAVELYTARAIRPDQQRGGRRREVAARPRKREPGALASRRGSGRAASIPATSQPRQSRPRQPARSSDRRPPTMGGTSWRISRGAEGAGMPEGELPLAFPGELLNRI